ncbi:MAG: hypothetical protein Q7J45_00675 [bacterium]|nr:hypothetical protein [bacterium]
MSDPIFPISLPAPLAGQYGFERKPLTTAMDTDAGGKRVRALHLNVPTVTTLSWKFTSAQYATFAEFYETDLAAGSKFFTCQLDDKRGGLASALVFFLEPPVETVDEGMNWTVSAKVMTAGVPLGKFPRLINVDGATGGEAPGGGGSGGVQDPVRAISLSNYSIKSLPTGQALVTVAIVASTGRLVYIADAGQVVVAGQWKAATNTTPSAQYSYARSLVVLEYRDSSGIPGNNPSQYGVPPVIQTTDPEALTVYRLDAAVNSITADRVTQLRSSAFHPWIKYLLTIQVKDQTSGYVATSQFTIELGTKPTGRENS